MNALTRTMQVLVLGTAVFAANAAELNCSSTGNVTPQTSAPPCAAEQYEVLTNQAYGQGASHLFDLYKPRAATQPLALVVWVHGGGWRSGSKENVNQALRLVCRGYAVASIDYRLSDEATLPSQAHDVKAAVRHLRANAAALGIDPERIALFGSSAGGHLVSLAGSSGGVAALEDLRLGNATTSSRVQAVACFFPPTDFLNWGKPSEDAVGFGPLIKFKPAFGPRSDTAEGRAELGKEISPAHFVRSNTAPTLIIHGDLDRLVPIQQAKIFEERCRKENVPFKLEVKEGKDHGWKEMDKDMALCADWFDQHLRGMRVRE